MKLTFIILFLVIWVNKNASSSEQTTANVCQIDGNSFKNVALFGVVSAPSSGLNVDCVDTSGLCRNASKQSANKIDRSLFDNFVLYGIVSEPSNDRISKISALCRNELMNIFESIHRDELWALKVLDASGTFRSSFVWGQNAWLGSKTECDFLNTPPRFIVSPDIPKSMVSNLVTTISPIELEFRMIFLNMTSPYRVDCPSHLKNPSIYRLGLCLPKSCSDQEIRTISESFFSKKATTFQKKYDVSLEVIHLRNMDLNNFLNRPEVTRISVILISYILLVAGFNITYKLIQQTEMVELKRFLKCFYFHDHFKSSFETSSSPNAINSINGLRTIICAWVILSHSVYFGMYAYDNYPMFIIVMERLATQPALAILIYVDGFFVFGGLLLVYNFLKDERTKMEIRNSDFAANLKLFLKKMVHRYIRLTPPFLFVIGVSHILAIYMQETSTHYIDETFDIYCTKQHLWSSILYIQNFYRINDLCVAWSWYLACDLQFYFITLLILFVHVKYPQSASFLFGALFASSTAIVVYVNDRINLLPSLDSLIYHNDVYYISPWNRIHPYLAGVTIGFTMFKLKDKTLPRHRFIPIGFWTFAAITFVITLFISYSKDLNVLSLSLGLTIGRYFIGLYIGSIVYMCHSGYGGIVNKVLSSRFFVHLNKMTYMIYLIHPVWILLLNGNQEDSLHFETLSVTAFYMGIILLSYISSVVLAPVIEIPFHKLSDEYVMKRVAKPKPAG